MLCLKRLRSVISQKKKSYWKISTDRNKLSTERVESPSLRDSRISYIKLQGGCHLAMGTLVLLQTGM